MDLVPLYGICILGYGEVPEFHSSIFKAPSYTLFNVEFPAGIEIKIRGMSVQTTRHQKGRAPFQDIGGVLQGLDDMIHDPLVKVSRFGQL